MKKAKNKVNNQTVRQILKLESVEKYYGSRSALTKAVDRISFTVDSSEFVAIMGASGSGKTTLLNCIATIDWVTAGKIYVDGEDITRLKRSEEHTSELQSLDRNSY